MPDVGEHTIADDWRSHPTSVSGGTHIAAHVSQVRAHPEDRTAVRLSQRVLAHYTGPVEHFLVE